jgi:hypothetical protein
MSAGVEMALWRSDHYLLFLHYAEVHQIKATLP